MSEGLQTVLEKLGDLLDPDPSVRGGVLLVGTTLAVASVVGAVKRRIWPGRSNQRAKVHLDLPEGQEAYLRIGGDKHEEEES